MKNQTVLLSKLVHKTSYDYCIDGTYVPRIFFINPNNTINYSMISNLYQYRYFYSNSRRLTEVMKDFLNRLEDDIDDEL